MNFALLNNGIVTNIIWINPEQQSEFQPGAPTGDFPVMVGDTYENGKFYRNGEEVTSETSPYAPTSDPYQEGYDQAVLDMIESGVL